MLIDRLFRTASLIEVGIRGVHLVRGIRTRTSRVRLQKLRDQLLALFDRALWWGGFHCGTATYFCESFFVGHWMIPFRLMNLLDANEVVQHCFNRFARHAHERQFNVQQNRGRPVVADLSLT